MIKFTPNLYSTKCIVLSVTSYDPSEIRNPTTRIRKWQIIPKFMNYKIHVPDSQYEFSQ